MTSLAIVNPDLEVQVVAAAKQMLQHQQADIPVVHRFGPGVYIREALMPKGSFVIGHFHRQPHLNMLLKGKLIMLRDDGSTETLEAPLCFTAPAGRKVAYVLEDVVWQNIYATEETDVERLEDTFLDKGEFTPSFYEKQNLYLLGCDADTHDYYQAIEDLGLTQKVVEELVKREDDLIPFPYGSYKVVVADSMIEGKGLFATSPIAAGEVIAPARINGCRTPAGRFTNHAATPNAVASKSSNGDIYFIATRDISGSIGGQVGEEITVDYRQVFKLAQGDVCQQQ